MKKTRTHRYGLFQPARFRGVAVCCLAAALASCSDDPAGQLPETGPEQTDPKGSIVFGASPVTRTELGSDGRSVTWHADDRINVYMLHNASGTRLYSPYSVQTGSIGEDGRSALFEGGLNWQAPASPHTFFAYYTGAASGIELDGTTGHLLLPDISSQEQSGADSRHIGQTNVMIAHPVTVPAPAEGETAFFNFSFSHLYPLLEFRIAAYDNPNNSVIESITLESQKAGESPAWESAAVDVKQTAQDAGYLTLMPGGAPRPIVLSVTGDKTARAIPAADSEDFRSDPTAASDAPEVSGTVFIARMAIQPCDLSRTPEQTAADTRNMRIVVKARESEIPYEYEFRNPGIRFEGGKRYVSTLVLKAAEGRPVIHVDEPGTLANKFGADARQTPSLKITGTINVLDFFTAGDLARSGLLHLDLSEATIAEQEDVGFGHFPANTIPEGSLNSTSLESIVLPTSITAIGNEAFAICQSLAGDLTIPSGVLSIGSAAFIGCTGFTGLLTIPESVTSIGEMAFSDCPFSAVRLLNPEPIPHSQNMFSTGMTFYVPTGSQADYQAAEGWKDNEYTFIED